MEIDAMQVDSVESTAAAEVTTDADLDVFDTGWESDGFAADDDMELEADETTEAAAEADQPTAEDDGNASQEETPEPTEEPTSEETQQPKAEDQRFVLKHLDEEREVGREEVIVLAQKGLDYDRKVPRLNDQINEYKQFIKELAGDLSVEQFMDFARAKMLVAEEAKQNREITEAEALLKIQAQRESNIKAKAEAEETAKQQEKATAEDRKQKNISDFIAAYPGVKADDIPATVWAEANRTGDLVGAYTRYENQKLKAENEALKQNEKNRARSTGSRKTQGAAVAKDPFDDAWDSF